jgi:hypothetical protein
VIIDGGVHNVKVLMYITPWTIWLAELLIGWSGENFRREVAVKAPEGAFIALGCDQKVSFRVI